LSDPYDQPAPLWMARVAGVVLGGFGLGLSALSVFLIVRQLQLHGQLETGASVFLAILLPITWFCLSVGGRLTFSKPNRSGSILSPFGWLVLAVLFSVIALGFTILLARSGELQLFSGIALAAAFAVWCWRARSRVLKLHQHSKLPSNKSLERTRDR